MKRFFKNIFIYFLIPGIVFGIIGEVLLRNIPNSYNYKKNYLDNNSEKIKILVLGPSTAYFNIDPAYLPPGGFNAANSLQSLNLDYEILKKYDGRWKNLEWIILPVGYGSLYMRLENNRKERERMSYYFIYYDLPIPHSLTDNFLLLSYNFRFNINRLIIHYIYKTDDLANDFVCSKLGWGTGFNFKNQMNLKESGKYFGKLETLKGVPVDSNLNVLKALINYARERNIKVLLYTEPVYRTFIENIDTNQLKETMNAVNELKNHYPNVFYANFMQDSSFAEIDFWDADHLNKFGAPKLTLKIDSIMTHLEK